MSFDPEWCRNEDYQCETCPFTALKDTDPGVAEHTLTLLSIFEPRDVVRAVHDTKTDNDSYEFGVMVEYTTYKLFTVKPVGMISLEQQF